MLPAKLPKYRRNGKHAFVELSGQRVGLGRYDAPESHQQYRRIIAEWLAADRSPPVAGDGMLLCELIARYYRHCLDYYRRPDGTATTEAGNYKQALRVASELYGDLPVGEFGPRQLEACRAAMVAEGWVRNQCNRQAGRIKRMFRWAVTRGICEAHQITGLDCLESLKAGRCGAREGVKVLPVPQGSIDAIEPYVSRQVWALVQLQLLSGARGGELFGLRQIDLDLSGPVWSASLDWHKTRHVGRDRTIYFGPRSQELLREFFDRPLDAPLFSPRDARAEQGHRARTHRRPLQSPTPRSGDRVVGDRYDRSSYRRAIARACQKAHVAHWHPHQLRHNAATAIRRQYGIEAAQVVLGHAQANVTQVYAERDAAKALEILAVVG